MVVLPRMDGMDMGSGSDSSSSSMSSSSNSSSSSTMSTMMVAFQNDMATTLYSERWTPSSTGTYAGTCIFLIVLAALFRGLFALRAVQESRWLDQELNRRYVVVNNGANGGSGNGKGGLQENLSRDSLKQNMLLSANGLEEEVMVVKKRHTHTRPWRLSVDPARAVLDTIIAGVSYLLMLAVMTMNVGYFCSILGGTFLGSLAVGRYAVLAEH